MSEGDLQSVPVLRGRGGCAGVTGKTDSFRRAEPIDDLKAWHYRYVEIYVGRFVRATRGPRNSGDIHLQAELLMDLISGEDRADRPQGTVDEAPCFALRWETSKAVAIR